MNYDEFLKQKKYKINPIGKDIKIKDINSILFPFQRDVLKWAVKKGRCAVFLDTGLGKGQPYGNKILTPNGWKNIEHLIVGDKIISSKGKIQKIIGVYPKNEIDTYRFYFSDGCSFVVDEEHLHIVKTNNDRARNKEWKVLSTTEILKLNNLRYSGKGRNYNIPIVSPILFPKKKLKIHPYLLGVLLGDGHLGNQYMISTKDVEIIERFKSLLPKGINILKVKGDNCDYRIITGRSGNRYHWLKKLFINYGLDKKLSFEKFIPKDYLYSDIEDRLDLLRGLMDTDGYIMKCGTCQFYSTSGQLIKDVLFLIRSLGGVPTFSKKKTSYKKNGKKYVCRDCYALTFSLKTFNPFYLTRKSERYNKKPRDNGRWIDKIEYEGKQKTICISTDSPDKSYVTENFIVTHNTFVQLEWARLLCNKSLIIAPLSVARQTIREGKKININVNYVRNMNELQKGINITNYEMLDNFDENGIESIILDESSILKSISGKTRQKLIDKFKNVKYKLCCTATPAPNDYIELGNHTEFLGICRRQEMLSMFFINANKEHTFEVQGNLYTEKGSNKGGQEWRLKHHAEHSFFEWMSKWSITMTTPSDLGYDDKKFILPELKINPIYIKTDFHSHDKLFFDGLHGLSDRADVRNDTVKDKIEIIKDIISKDKKGQWIIWCGLDIESKIARENIKDSIEVKGTDNIEYKSKMFEDFQDNKFNILITKIKIGGFGLNFQNSHNMIFFGLNDSWEMFYQTIRRQYRFGQKYPVNVYVVLSEQEREIFENIQRKDLQAKRLRIKMIEKLKDLEKGEIKGMEIEKEDYMEDTIEDKNFTAMLGDSCKRLKEIKDNSIDLSVYSPPFIDLFVYSNSNRDIGNCKSKDEFYNHYEFIVKELLRVTKEGRISCVHTSDIPAMANRDGYIGLKDFPGEVLRLHEKNGWIFVGRCFIQKNPQAQAIRVKSKSLLFVQLNKDSSCSRPALVDQVLIFRKKGENKKPITPVKNGEMDNETWIKWAHGIWTDINETNTLQYYIARDKDDEKHVCPLQLETIERCIKLYSNPKETVCDPFMGIGSTGFVSLKCKRNFVGCELKESYYKIALDNLNSISGIGKDLFD